MFFGALLLKAVLSSVLISQLQATSRYKNDNLSLPRQWNIVVDVTEHGGYGINHLSKKKPLLADRKKITTNITYNDVPDNSMHVPFTENHDEEQSKKRKPRKNPKRTVQKIIKKNKNKRNKFFMNVATSSTQPTVRIYETEEIFSKDEAQTTVASHKKQHYRNRNNRRNPMPFTKLHKRTKRDAAWSDAYILQDLDEIEFLSKEDGYDAYKVHVQRHW